MKRVAHSFFEYLDMPLRNRTRILLLIIMVPLALSVILPLWRISMEAPQYPQGLYLDIYSYKLDAGNDGHDLKEINVLNHYIGMQNITREELRDLDWMPFALGGLALLILRTALLGNIRALIDMVVVTTYVTGFAFCRFAYMLYSFGHNLDPKAPMDIEPFTPVLLGTKQIANFTTHSFPLTGGITLFIFVTGIFLVTGWSLLRGRRDHLALLKTESPTA